MGNNSSVKRSDEDKKKESKEKDLSSQKEEKEKLTVKICLVGPPSSGKTTLLYRLKTGRVLEKGEILLQKKEGTRLVPCPNWGVGFNHEELPFENVILDVWDLSGFSENVWEQFGNGCVAIVYVVDAANEDEVPRAARSLWKLMQKEWFSDIPILVLTNKADQVDICLKQDDISNQLQLDKMLVGRIWKLAHVSVQSGDGLKDAFDWLEKVIREDEKLINRSLNYLEAKRSFHMKTKEVGAGGGLGGGEENEKREELDSSGDTEASSSVSSPRSPAQPTRANTPQRRNSSRLGKVVGSSSAFLDFFRSPRRGTEPPPLASPSGKSPRTADSTPSSPSLRVETPKSGKKSEGSSRSGGSMLLRTKTKTTNTISPREEERKDEKKDKEKSPRDTEKEENALVRRRSSSDVVRVHVSDETETSSSSPTSKTMTPREKSEAAMESPKRRSFLQHMVRVETFMNFGKKSDDKLPSPHSPSSPSPGKGNPQLSFSSSMSSTGDSEKSPKRERKFGLVQTKATTSKRVFVYRPLDQEGTAVLILIGDTCQNFIEKASFKLGIEPEGVSRVLLMNGTEVQHIDELVQDDQVYIS